MGYEYEWKMEELYKEEENACAIDFDRDNYEELNSNFGTLHFG